MSRAVRLVDVAKKAEVSRVAAGKVLLGSGSSVRVSEATAERIINCARELGYQPNRSAQRLKGKTGRLLGAIIKTNAPDIELRRLIELERLSYDKGHQLLVTAICPDNKEDIMAATQTLAAQGAAGIIFVTAGVDFAAYLKDAPLIPPFVCCDIPPMIKKTPGVILDIAHAYRQTIRHFAKTGRRRIGVISIDWHSFPDIYSEYRLKILQDEAEALGGLEVVNCPVSITPEQWTPSLDEAKSMISLFKEAGVDAILAYSDNAAARLLQALSSFGIMVPDDVAVCGLSNLQIGELISPQLTTIDERPKEVAEAMLQLMLEQLKDRNAPTRQVVIKPKLIIRESS